MVILLPGVSVGQETWRRKAALSPSFTAWVAVLFSTGPLLLGLFPMRGLEDRREQFKALSGHSGPQVKC